MTSHLCLHLHTPGKTFPDPEQSRPSVWILSLVTPKNGCQGQDLKTQGLQGSSFHSSSIHSTSLSTAEDKWMGPRGGEEMSQNCLKRGQRYHICHSRALQPQACLSLAGLCMLTTLLCRGPVQCVYDKSWLYTSAQGCRSLVA